LQCKSLQGEKTREREREKKKSYSGCVVTFSILSISLLFVPCRPFGKGEEKEKKTRWVTDKKETRRGIHIER